MAIEFKARVLLELGAELISSDAVALYELIKNAIDAKSPDIKIFITVVIQHSDFQEILSKLVNMEANGRPFNVDWLYAEIERLIEPDAPQKAKDIFFSKLGSPSSFETACNCLKDAYFCANKIQISDAGHGMTLEALKKCYLTIGTPMRLLEKKSIQSARKNEITTQSTTQPTLGAKGIGRLAAMRLGHYVFVKTATNIEKADKTHWNLLKLDFRPIFDEPDLDASALNYEPSRGKPKDDPEFKGTTLIIRDLQSDWTETKLQALVKSELAKLADPFHSSFVNNFFKIKLQDKDVLLPFFEKLKLKYADAVCEAKFGTIKSSETLEPLKGIELAVEVNYQRYGEKRVKHLTGDHLASCVRNPVGRKRRSKASDLLPDADSIVSALQRLGPFEMKFWWFNRGKIRKEDNELWTSTLEPFVRNWSGGLLVYRDGFRVYPYGAASDDWLDLDRNALAASQYKVNRAQIIGYLRISDEGNPSLHDQTNREGFRDCEEKEALRRLLRHIFISECRTFLEDVDKKKKAETTDTIDEIEMRLGDSQRVAVDTLRQLKSRVPEEEQAVSEILYQLGEIHDAWERAKVTIKKHDAELEQYIHLAGIGLQVEFIAHELARMTDNTLSMLSDKQAFNVEATRKALELQIKTLDKRIRVMDLLSIPGRQRRTSCNIVEIVKLLMDVHAAKLKRHGISFVLQGSSNIPLIAKVENGQILQIFDNLFTNSFYWLRNRLDRSAPPQIIVAIDSANRTVTFSDNGPGVPNCIAEDIFTAFFTTKPSGDGRGLGLFISQKLAAYNDATLLLGTEGADEIHHSFVLSFKNTPEK